MRRLAELLGVDRATLKASWDEFEPVLESGRAPGPDPELTWLRAVTNASDADLARAETDWDKDRREAYAYVLDRLGVPAGAATYVGDGSNNELAGARAAGFAQVVLAEQAAATAAPGALPTCAPRPTSR